MRVIPRALNRSVPCPSVDGVLRCHGVAHRRDLPFDGPF